ncbi:hypothetical protein MPSEU_000363800 [Mayamaea pseudoterrestris]|nr:hypothetical protein MPSEU_000363800 [Mayamaea pseudoterrestris]
MTMTTTSPTPTLPTPLPFPIKGDADWRNYRCLQLHNGVTLVMVHDAQSKTTAASATVNVGAAADPRSLSGLAHFCEHMCFLGSREYPGENDYKKYLASHGGRSNASTSLHTTNYKFEVVAEHAEKALSMFAQFFVAPLFSTSGTSREVQAVDAENSKNLASDVRRRLQILKHLGDQSHAYTKFTTGNSHTLPTNNETQTNDMRQALLDFHSFHYRPNNLTVVVAGPQLLEQLEEWLVSKFASMPKKECLNDDTTTSTITETQQLVLDAAKEAPLYGFDQPQADYKPAFHASVPSQDGNTNKWPFVYTIKPVKNMRQLVIMWTLPPVGKNLDQSPVSVLSHLLGHEGTGSAFCVLQELGLISSLSAGARHSGPEFTLFQISVGLTEQGEENWSKMVDVIMQHVRLIQAACQDEDKVDDLKRIYEESAKLSSMFFHQNSPGGVYDFAPSLAGRVLTEGTEQCLSAGSMLTETADSFPLARVKEFVDCMGPTNCFIERCSIKAWDEMEAVEAAKEECVHRRTEPWYGIDYFVSAIDAAHIQSWDGTGEPLLDVREKLQLPRPNRFIPRTLTLCDDLSDEAKAGPRIEKEIDPPKLLMQDAKIGRLWHRLDDRYALPKSVVSVLIRTASGDHVKVDGKWQPDTDASMRSNMLAGIFSEAMAVDTYDAHLAGLNWNLNFTPYGVQLSCSGFSDRLPDLALTVLTAFLKGDFLTDSYFSSTKDRMCRQLKTFFESKRADTSAMFYRDFLLTSDGMGIDASLSASEATTLDDVKKHFNDLLANLEWSVDCFLTGNVSEKQAKLFFSDASSLLSKSFVAPALDSKGKSLAMWLPGEIERRLPAGEDVEFHFTSQNLSDENGAVVVTYQSPIPGYRGEILSTPTSLKSSAAMRLISHILREPLFDELRTKQTLGYVVSSWYDVSISTQPINELDPRTVPVDLLVIAVLSRKLSPLDIMTRIDDFLKSFRQILANMPPSELQNYAAGLSTTMRKPVQKLGTEASIQKSKIRSYAPEILSSEMRSSSDIPWDNSKALAKQIEALAVSDLVETWDRVVLSTSRARITSCVYGTTFPLNPMRLASHRFGSCRKKVVVNSLSEILEFRSRLSGFDNTPTPLARPNVWKGVIYPAATRKTILVGATVTAVAVAGFVFLGRASRKQERWTK